MSVQVLPFSQLFIAVVLFILCAFSIFGFVRVRQALIALVRAHIFYIIVCEVIFLGMVFLLGWIRSYGPNIQNFEMFMDEGFLAAIMRSPHFPPNDMWLSGYSINYYYYAHFTIAMLAKLLGQSPSIAFNTGICIFFGLTAVNLFGVTSNIVSWARYQRRSTVTVSGTSEKRLWPAFLRRRQTADKPQQRDRYSDQPDTVLPSLSSAIPFGLLTILMGEVLGNLASTQQWWKAHDDLPPEYWFNTTRIIDKTINEFPAFSFLLSCFHAHVLALAFTILAIGMAFNLFLEQEGRGIYAFGRGWRLPWTLGTTALVIGGLFTMNGWDYPTYLGLALVCLVLQQWLTASTRLSLALMSDIAIACLSLMALSFVLYLPFYLSFVSPSQGIGIVGAADRTPLRDELLIYGLFAFVFLSLLLASTLKRPLLALSSLTTADDDTAPGVRRIDWTRVGFVGVFLLLLIGLLTLVFMGNSTTFVVAASITMLGVILLFYNIGDRSHAFTLLLGTIAFALIALCEVFFLKDVFAGNYPRMNTVFKFYFQAWA